MMQADDETKKILNGRQPGANLVPVGEADTFNRPQVGAGCNPNQCFVVD